MEAPTTEQLIDHVMSDLFNTGKVAVIDQIGADNLCVHYPQANTPLYGREAVKRAFSRTRSAFPDAYFLVEETLISSDRVMLRWTGRATHTGVFWGIAATKHQIMLSGISYFHFTSGKITEFWLFIDALSLYQQLGGKAILGSA